MSQSINLKDIDGSIVNDLGDDQILIDMGYQSEVTNAVFTALQTINLPDATIVAEADNGAVRINKSINTYIDGAGTIEVPNGPQLENADLHIIGLDVRVEELNNGNYSVGLYAGHHGSFDTNQNDSRATTINYEISPEGEFLTRSAHAVGHSDDANKWTIEAAQTFEHRLGVVLGQDSLESLEKLRPASSAANVGEPPLDNTVHSLADLSMASDLTIARSNTVEALPIVSLSRVRGEFVASGDGAEITEIDNYNLNKMNEEIASQIQLGRITHEEARDQISQRVQIEKGYSSYGEVIKLNLGGKHDFEVTNEGLESLASISTPSGSYASPDYNIEINGANRLIISPEVIAELDPQALYQDTIGDGQPILLGGDMISFGDKNNTGFLLSGPNAGSPGVEAIIIGDREIDFGDRIREVNEIEYSEDVRDMTRREGIMKDIYQDIVDAVEEAQRGPVLDQKVAPNQPSVNNLPSM